MYIAIHAQQIYHIRIVMSFPIHNAYSTESHDAQLYCPVLFTKLNVLLTHTNE